MNGDTSPEGVASRIRGILGGQDRGMVGSTARRLGVSEVALRISIDAIDPHPAVEVIAAIVEHYGVDPTWLLMGEYDGATHRAAIEEDAQHVHTLVADFFAKRLTPVSTDAQRDELQHTPGLRLEA